MSVINGNFKTGSAAAFAALTNKDPYTFYFVGGTDLYFGDKKLTNAADIQNAIDTLNGDELVDGSIANKIATALASTELNAGQIHVADIAKNYTEAADEGIDLESLLADLNNKISASTNLTITEQNQADTGFFKTIVFSDGSGQDATELYRLNLPKEYFLKDADIYTVNATDKETGGKFENDSNFSVGDKYIDFVVNIQGENTTGNDDPKHIYLKVSDLGVQTYIGSGDQSPAPTSGVIINVNNGVISATVLSLDGNTIMDGTVTKAKLAQSVQDTLDSIGEIPQSYAGSETTVLGYLREYTDNKVGSIPAGSSATNVVGYVDEQVSQVVSGSGVYWEPLEEPVSNGD